MRWDTRNMGDKVGNFPITSGARTIVNFWSMKNSTVKEDFQNLLSKWSFLISLVIVNILKINANIIEYFRSKNKQSHFFLWNDKITLIGEACCVDVRLIFLEETYYIFRATKSAEPILKKRDGLFALARILRLRQARPDNYWLLNSAPARRSQKSVTMPGPPAAVTAKRCSANLSITRVLSATLLSLINEIINEKRVTKRQRRKCFIEVAIFFETRWMFRRQVLTKVVSLKRRTCRSRWLRFLRFTLRRTFMSRGKKRWRNYAWDVRCGSLNSDETGAYATIRLLQSSRPLWSDEACSCLTDNPQLSLLN